MFEPALKFKTMLFSSKTLKLLITFKMAYSYCFSLGGNIDFPDFLQKKFYNIDCRRLNFSVVTHFENFMAETLT